MNNAQRYMLIDQNSNVVNVVMWDGGDGWQPPSGLQAIPSDNAGPGWTYKNGTFTPPAPPTPKALTAEQTWAIYQLQAQSALADSDKTILRCYEAGVSVPSPWASYRKALRSIIGASAGDSSKPLPSRPEYPAGT
ncbi:hypothetical protein [Chromobacterium vaccinii]|uniref:hypothetical protein n=1 Tax=Chromobacterium vaccinii TaxID=1108595 RepID=UPI001E577DE1|nr:hypothetical protein [Chromobacterium vaccinii]MCD4498542.1 hypothetical protein [Chromobacterium vaccinii]